jgi:hypothetical protein
MPTMLCYLLSTRHSRLGRSVLPENLTRIVGTSEQPRLLTQFCDLIRGATLGNGVRVTTGRCSNAERNVRWVRTACGGGLIDGASATGLSGVLFCTAIRSAIISSGAVATNFRGGSRSSRRYSDAAPLNHVVVDKDLSGIAQDRTVPSRNPKNWSFRHSLRKET